MVDTFRPLWLTKQAAALENAHYPYTSLPSPDHAAGTRRLDERGPEAFPD